MARLSTHVLDTARGVPAAGIEVTLHLITDAGRRQVASAITNADGRTDQPLLSGAAIEPGIYELTFHATLYFQAHHAAVSSPPFLGDVVIRVGLADAGGNYHVPLLLSPYGYSTYRGS
jgi:5-hydroxyisourate hydrolase